MIGRGKLRCKTPYVPFYQKEEAHVKNAYAWLKLQNRFEKLRMLMAGQIRGVKKLLRLAQFLHKGQAGFKCMGGFNWKRKEKNPTRISRTAGEDSHEIGFTERKTKVMLDGIRQQEA